MPLDRYLEADRFADLWQAALMEGQLAAEQAVNAVRTVQHVRAHP